MQDGPRIFDLSPPGLGGEWLARLMCKNGIRARHGEGGALARDITWGALTGTAPCPDRPGIRFYGGLEAAQDIAAAPAFGWRYFRYLRQVFRQAVFLLVLRDPEDWIAARLEDGTAARLQAIARGCGVDDLPAIWRAEYRGLITKARGFFADDPRYVEIPHAALSFPLMRDALAPWYGLRHPIPPPMPESALQAAFLPMPQPHPAPGRMVAPLHGQDAALADRMAAFCLGTWSPGDVGIRDVSGLYGHFDGVAGLRRRNGQPWPVMRDPDLPGQPFVGPGGDDKAARNIGVLNDLLRLGRLQALHIDMQDARKLGLDALPGVPLVTYNRRAGARNLTLWPLPGYHTPGAAGFAHPSSPDAVPWAAKADCVVWRGDLSGQERRADGGLGHSAHRILSGLDRIGPEDEAGLAAILARLGQVPRMAAMRSLHAPDFDMGLTLSRFMQDFAPVLTGYVDHRRPREWFYGFRYILSLPGYDTGSNFIMAANSGSVVMKAEDGWEVFYSCLFNPWEHYIPLKVDASDAPERLEWARTNPAACRQIVAAANAACARLADTRLRAAVLHHVLDGLEART